MATINSFEDLKVWQKSRELCQQIFHLIQTEKFAKDYALKDQINRSSGSVMDNIAEGFGRQSSNEFINHLSIAAGSLLEVKSQLYRAADRHYISEVSFGNNIDLINEIGKMLTALIAYLNKSDIRGLKFKDRNPKT
jgi:four helix bundle protein